MPMKNPGWSKPPILHLRSGEQTGVPTRGYSLDRYGYLEGKYVPRAT